MRPVIAVLAALAFTTATALPALAADDSKVKAATNRVETGAKKIGSGDVGDGVKDTATGIGKTVEEGAKFTGEKFKEAGKSAEPDAKHAGNTFRDSAVSFGHSVKNFFTRLFSN